eukprot:6070130-Prymnesium_polylepis.1
METKLRGKKEKGRIEAHDEGGDICRGAHVPFRAAPAAERGEETTARHPFRHTPIQPRSRLRSNSYTPGNRRMSRRISSTLSG